jgi:putative solute:sodium symporter small subunit
MAFKSDDDRNAYWRKNINLMLTLLVIWAVASYGFGILLRPMLDVIPVGGVGLGFWFAQNGSIYVFLFLVFFYAKKMRQLDREFGVDDD